MKDLIASIIDQYTSETYKDEFEKAHKEYIEKAGKAINDSPEYEAYMQRFQAWFVFHWKDSQGLKLIEKYLKDNNLDLSQEQSLLDINFSFFEVLSQTKNNWIVYDILHEKKFYLGDLSLVLMEKDLFIGRTISHDTDYLLEGVCLVPKNLLTLIKKQCKQVRAMISLEKEEKYLLKLESLCLRANMYRNLNHESLFDFPLV